MSMSSRRSRGVAAVTVAGVSVFPFCAAAAASIDVSIKNHTPQEAVEGPNVAIQADFRSRSSHSISRVEFLVDGQVIENHILDQPAQQGSFVFAWDTTRVSNEVHTVTTRAYDDRNQAGVSEMQLFVDNQAVVDAQEPVLRVTVPKEGAVVSGTFDVRVQGVQKSPNQPIPYIMIKLDDSLIGYFGKGDTSINFPYDGSDLKDGPHVLQAATRMNDNTTVLSPPVIVIVSNGGGLTMSHNGTGMPDPDVEGNGPGGETADPGPAPTGITPSTNNTTPGSRPLTHQDLVDQANGIGIPGNSENPSFVAPNPGTTVSQNPLQMNPAGTPIIHGTGRGLVRPATPPKGSQLAIMASRTTVTDLAEGYWVGSLQGEQSMTPAGSAPSRASLPLPSARAWMPEIAGLSTPGRMESVFTPAAMTPARTFGRAPGLHPIQMAINSMVRPTPQQVVWGSGGPTATGQLSMAPVPDAGIAGMGTVIPAIQGLPSFGMTSNGSPGSLAPLGAITLSPGLLGKKPGKSYTGGGVLGQLSNPGSPTQQPGLAPVQSFGPDLSGMGAAIVPISPLLPSGSPVGGSLQGPAMAMLQTPGLSAASIEPTFAPGSASILPGGPPAPMVSGLPSPGGLIPNTGMAPASTANAGATGSESTISVVPATPVRLVVVQTSEPTHPNQAPTLPVSAPESANPGSSDAAETEPIILPIPFAISPNGPQSLGTVRVKVRREHIAPVRMALRPEAEPDTAAFARAKAHMRGAPHWLRVAYDNKLVNFDVPPMIVKNQVEAPFRAIFEQAGGSVDWSAATQTVTAQNNGKVILLRIGSRTALVNHRQVHLVLPAFLHNGRTMVPLSFIREALDVNIQFNEKTGEIILTSKHISSVTLG